MRTIRIVQERAIRAIESSRDRARREGTSSIWCSSAGERTVALAQQARMKDPDAGYDPLLEERMRACCRSAPPKASRSSPIWRGQPGSRGDEDAQIARSLGLSSLKIAASSR